MRILYTIALVAVIGFTMASCDNNPGNDDDNPLIAGTFNYGGGNAKFYADYATSGRSVSRASGMSATEKELTGKIEDGDIIFNLKGVYNIADKKFFLSAGSSILVYQIAGSLSNGNMTETQASVKVKSGDDWTVYTVSVTSSKNVSIDGSASNTQVNGIPSAWFGTWKIDGEDGPQYYTMTAWQFILNELPNEPAGFLDIVSLPYGKLEMVWETYVYYADSDGNEWTEIMFAKVWMDESGQGLLLTAFIESFSETYAEAKAYDTDTADLDDPESIQKVTLTRP
jgi:hypothetical protein